MTRLAAPALVTAIVVVAALLGGGPASGQEPAAAERHAGRPYYVQYCASCHGVAADGLGPAVPALRTRPPDLTRLATKYGEPLPKAALTEFIDGEQMVRGHGSREMPVWGAKLRRELPPKSTPAIQRRTLIQSIVDYLAAIQRPDEAP